MKARHAQTAFNGGEVSPRIAGRFDLDGIYDRAAARMVNFVPTVEGPALKRSGTRYVKPAAATATWLTRFQFNVLQSYVIEWSNGKLRFFTNGGQIESAPGVPYEVAVPYTAAEAPFVCCVQSYDRLYMTHPNYPPAALTRTGAETFVYAPLTLKDGPFKGTNTDKTKTIQVTSALATTDVDELCTLTASAPIFAAGHVGCPLMIETADFGDMKAWEPGIDIGMGSKRRSDGKAYYAATGGKTGSVQPTHTEGSEWDGMASGSEPKGVNWQYYHDRIGIAVVEEFVSTTSVKVRVSRRIPSGVLSEPTYKWAFGLFSTKEGWPHLVHVWGGRLFFFKGVELCGSVIGDYLNFAPLTRSGIFAPDMAFRRPMGISDPPLWVFGDKDAMLVGTTTQEVMVGAINKAAGLTNDNIIALPQGSVGSAQVWPIAAGSAALFVQRGGRKIRDAAYTYQTERFAGDTLNTWARHITRSGVAWMAFQQEPEDMLFAGRSDGRMVVHPYSPQQQTKGFARVELGGGATVICGVVIPSEDGQRDELWLLADLDGSKAILKLEDWWEEDTDLDDAERLDKLKRAFFVDFGVSYDGVPKQTFNTGLAHLNGRAVHVLADGEFVDGLTVAGGSITLPKAASIVHIGLGYTAELTLLPPEIRGGGPMQGIRRQIKRILLRLIDSHPFKIVNRRGDVEPIFKRKASMPAGQPIPLLNGLVDDPITVQGGSSREDMPTFRSDRPLPAMISFVASSVELEDGGL